MSMAGCDDEGVALGSTGGRGEEQRAPRADAIKLAGGQTVGESIAAARAARAGACCPSDEAAHEIARKTAVKEVRRGFWERVKGAEGYKERYARADKCLNRYLVDREAAQLRRELEGSGVGADDAVEVAEWLAEALDAAGEKTSSKTIDAEDIDAVPSGRDPATTQLRVAGKVVTTLPTGVYSKLAARYTGAADEKDASILWTVLRYERLTGGRSGLQDAIPEAIMDVLAARLDVVGEIFASPLNCLSPCFCSLFPDSDCVFGSVGDAFAFHPREGSFEANPPFTEAVLDRMAAHFESLLDAARAPLAFTVVIPEWTDPVPQAVTRMRASAHHRADIIVPKGEHAYCDGLTGAPTPAFLRNTLVILLMNDAGAAKWGGTERVAALKAELLMVWGKVPRLEATIEDNPAKRRKVG